MAVACEQEMEITDFQNIDIIIFPFSPLLLFARITIIGS